MSQPTRVKKPFSVATTFGFNIPKEVTVEGYKDVEVRVPKRDNDYVFIQGWVSDFLAWFAHGRPDGLHVFGETGCGKSSLILQVCSRLNIPVERPPVQKDLSWSDLIGFYTVIDGDTVFQEGPLTLAMRYGRLFLLDEGDTIDPDVNAGLYAILEGAPLVLSQQGGMVIEPAEGFGIVTTGNSAGAGDQDGFYSGIQTQSIAYMDRFWTVEMGHLPKDVEVILLKKKSPSLSDEMLGRMVDYANIVRKLFKGVDEGDYSSVLPQVNVTFSTRSLIRWSKQTVLFKGKAATGISPIHYALDRSLAYRAYPEARNGLHEIAQRIFGEEVTIPKKP